MHDGGPSRPGRLPWIWLQPHKVFLAIASTLGLATLLLNPPFQAPDEPNHFYRVFQLSEGHLIGTRQSPTSSGGELPSIIIGVSATENIAFHAENKATKGYFARKLTPLFVRWDGSLHRQYGHFPNTVLYSPIAYVPQLAAVLLAKFLRLGPLLLLYVMRLAGFATATVLGYAALQRLPAYRWATMLVLLSPMNLYLMGTTQVDGVLIAGTVLLMALLLQIDATTGKEVTRSEKVVILLLVALVSMAKYAYLPIGGLALFFVIPRLKSLRERLVFGSACVGLAMLPSLVWIATIESLIAPGRADIPIDPHAQIRLVIGAPLSFLALVVQTIRLDYASIYAWMVGVLGWGDTVLPHWFYQAYGCGLLACVLLESRGTALRWPQRLLGLGAATGVFVLIFLLQYAYWNAPGSRGRIEGVQGRYFIPLEIVAVLCSPAIPKLRPPAWLAPAVGIAVGVTSAVVCVSAVVTRFYLP